MKTMKTKATAVIIAVLMCAGLTCAAYANGGEPVSDDAAWDIYRIPNDQANIGYDGVDCPQPNGVIWGDGIPADDAAKDIYLINGSEPVGIDGDPPNGIIWDDGSTAAPALDGQQDSASTEPYNPDGDYQADTPDPYAQDIYPDANGKFKSIEWLVANWQAFGYPDYVGGVYSTDGTGGNIKVLLTDDNEATRAQVLASLVDASGVTFGTAKYSYNAMQAVVEEIVADFFKAGDKNVKGIWIGWTSLDGVKMGFGGNGDEFRVIVTINEDAAEEYTGLFGAIYGDMVFVEAVDADAVVWEGGLGGGLDGGTGELVGSLMTGSPIPYPGIANVTPISLPTNNLQLALLIAGLALAVIGVALFVFRARFIPALQTNNGTVVTGDAPLSKEQTVAAIKDSAVTPPEGTFQSIIDKIEKTGKPQK